MNAPTTAAAENDSKPEALAKDMAQAYTEPTGKAIDFQVERLLC